MQEDILLKKLFQTDRWTAAITKGYDKDIRKDQLYSLTKPQTRAALYQAIASGRYRISPPHTAQIPKDTPGEFRTVYVNEPMDRILLSMINDLLFEECPEFVHPSCKSYLKGTGCSDVVLEASRQVCATQGEHVGFKADLSKYFDSVPLSFIDGIFDKVEIKTGPSRIIDLLRDYYHNDLYFDETTTLRNTYQSLKQGCAVAAFLADSVLFHLDQRINEECPGYYVRYSDDILYLGDDHPKAMNILKEELSIMRMSLNPKKVEMLSADHWFKFLGFSIKGADISLSSTRIKTFQKEIESRTIRNRKASYERSLREVNGFLYRGNGTHSWATQVLRVCNVSKDIDTLNAFVMDCLRAKRTGKHKIGGLGYVKDRKDSCIDRGRGRNVKSNRSKTQQTIQGYLTIGCMRKALLTSRAAFDTLTATLA